MVGKEEKLPICISHIKPGGVADRVGGLKIGDQLISVNGVFVEGQRRELANELLKMNSSVKLVVRPKGKTNFSVISKKQTIVFSRISFQFCLNEFSRQIKV